MRDPYQVLGVAKNATADQIRAAYRKLAKANHPDLHPGDKAAEARFKDASAANDLLSDPDKRARYDRGEIDAAGTEQAPRGYRAYGEGAQGQRYSAHGGGGFDFDDLSELFGGGGFSARTRAAFHRRGSDVQYMLDLDFAEAALGTTKRMTLPGTSAPLDVRVPPGTISGTVLRLKGKGEPGANAGPAGDALIEITVRPHPRLRREGDDLHLDLDIGLRVAILGGEVETPTLDGTVKLKVPPRSNTGAVLRLKGKGVPDRDGARGDQYVRLRIVIEDPADPELAKFLESWRVAAGAA
ncbi:DnaJ C-terminal domain-containing protein [Roseiterribacter gracilis]|uniref:Molecular chaperone DnaJ n=1 Tax=Roseiterribacter gracilis TaxID=2812848 RepID=A0A8S8XHF9_9PROT|nr:molecular chaperone DnaJ [Rhodospirillales bacterium TMPK1]